MMAKRLPYLYHELAHAMHMMNGTWRYFASEEQAIEEENIFRHQLAKQQGRPLTQRYRIEGVPSVTHRILFQAKPLGV